MQFSSIFTLTTFSLPIPNILCQNFDMKNLTTSLCLTIAVILGSVGVGLGDPIRFSDVIEERTISGDWVVYELDKNSGYDGLCRLSQEVLIGRTISDFTIFPQEGLAHGQNAKLVSIFLYDEFTKTLKTVRNKLRSVWAGNQFCRD